MTARKSATRIAAAAAVGIALLIAPNGAAQAESGDEDVIIVPLTECDKSKTATIGPITARWAKAHWTVRCYEGSRRTTVTGWVEDLKSDGYCARVKADINSSWKFSARACPKGDVKNFTLSGGYDTNPQVFLYREK